MDLRRKLIMNSFVLGVLFIGFGMINLYSGQTLGGVLGLVGSLSAFYDAMLAIKEESKDE